MLKFSLCSFEWWRAERTATVQCHDVVEVERRLPTPLQCSSVDEKSTLSIMLGWVKVSIGVARSYDPSYPESSGNKNNATHQKVENEKLWWSGGWMAIIRTSIYHQLFGPDGPLGLP